MTPHAKPNVFLNLEVFFAGMQWKQFSIGIAFMDFRIGFPSTRAIWKNIEHGHGLENPPPMLTAGFCGFDQQPFIWVVFAYLLPSHEQSIEPKTDYSQSLSCQKARALTYKARGMGLSLLEEVIL